MKLWVILMIGKNCVVLLTDADRKWCIPFASDTGRISVTHQCVAVVARESNEFSF